MRKLLTAAALTATLAGGAAALLPADGASAAPAKAPTMRVVGDCEHAQFKPKVVIIACGDGGVFFKNLRYSTWNSSRSTGTGEIWINTDDPNAAAGHYYHAKIKFTMDEPKRVAGQLRYSRIITATTRHGRTYRDTYYPPVRASR